MSVMTAVMLSFLAGFAYFSRRFFGDPYLERPIVLAPIVGLVMGDLHTGLVVGGMLELIFMGVTNVGNSIPPNYTIGGVLGTAFAVSTGQGLETALLIAVPAALLGVFFEMIAKTVCVFFISAADRLADRGNDRDLARLMHLGNAVHFLSNAIPTFIALVLGEAIVKTIVEGIPSWLKDGLAVAGNLLPALGFALLLSILASRSLFPFFFIGFLIAAYVKMGILGVAVLGFCIALIMQSRRNEMEAHEVSDAEAATAAAPTEGVFTRQDIRRLFFRSFAIQSAFSFDRMQAYGFIWAVLPMLRKLYKGRPEEFTAAMKRHLVLYNSHAWLPGPVMALTLDLEARKAAGEDIDEQSIQGLKSGLMGPIAGIGDSLFNGTLKPVLGGAAAALALQGNLFAPVLFFLGTNIVHVAVRWYTLNKGFALRERFLAVMASGEIKRMMEAATLAGLMTVGALTATWLKISTPISYQMDKNPISLQAMLDGIMPKLLPLAVVMIVFWLIRRRMKTTVLMYGLIASGIILGALKILN
ncbi:PTS system mannose/fructose/sorbose family transporter subunit IID [Paenibacillus hamazuiensis]|uniref:PTS system mannose/fructose/sorbose family transporter subunit IID n=1 Tax=Paenibacillus hamazuiensis TaxID=2936508 RepID=UPI00200D6705|nr:PTS system mannose/fructose/sorbose family transporter subunit IID [Paenibacillus hamazuiensis]